MKLVDAIPGAITPGGRVVNGSPFRDNSAAGKWLVPLECPVCGTQVSVRPNGLTNGCRQCVLTARATAAHTEASPKAPIGTRFGKFTVVDGPREPGKARVQCDCGSPEKVVEIWAMRTGHTVSCGCHSRETVLCVASRPWKRTHGDSNTRLYGIYRGMLNRCENPNVRSFSRYGGRGITVCEEWRNNFAVFRDWAQAHGYTDDLTIDRVDVNGNYEPANCEWVTAAENTRRANADRWFVPQRSLQASTDPL